MNYDTDDTIAAIATAPGGAARGIVRVGGPRACGCVERVFLPADGERPLKSIRTRKRVAGHVPIELCGARRSCPAMLLFWPTSASYTRQPIAELHLPGGQLLLQAVLRAACEAGARPAEPGEFTFRAFLAGRLDLTQAEAVLGLVEARTERQLQSSLEQLAGGLSEPLRELRQSLMQLLAEIEAGLDFVDEDIEFVTQDHVCDQLRRARADIDALSNQLRARAVDSEPPRVVLYGAPNAGKSSLFNRLARQFAGRTSHPAAAVVSSRAGTTRDYLRNDWCWEDGLRCQFVDTAGIGHAALSEVDGLSQQAARAQAEAATIGLHCVEPACDSAAVHSLSATTTKIIHVVTKCDMSEEAATRLAQTLPAPVVVTSSVTGRGVDHLIRFIRETLEELAAPDADAIVGTAVRCRESLHQAGAAIASSLSTAERGEGDELIAVDIRVALDSLGRVVGAVYTDDILDLVFSKFCIGK